MNPKIEVTLKDCPYCGKTHEKLLYVSLQEGLQPQDFSHQSQCPDTGKYILLKESQLKG